MNGFFRGHDEEARLWGKMDFLVMECVTSITYSVLVNDQPGKVLKPARGIRHRDPISPYLFLLCAEGLHSLLETTKRRGEIRGKQSREEGVRINHLLFDDDSVIFGRVSMADLVRIQRLLSIYEKASGQCLNKQKATIFFSSNTPM